MPEDKIFPLVDRRAPLLDRIRGNGEETASVSKAMGERVAKFFKNDNPEVEAEELSRSVSEFREGLAEELDVDKSLVTDGVTDRFVSLLESDDLIEDMPEGDGNEEEGEEEGAFSVE